MAKSGLILGSIERADVTIKATFERSCVFGGWMPGRQNGVKRRDPVGFGRSLQESEPA